MKVVSLLIVTAAWSLGEAFLAPSASTISIRSSSTSLCVDRWNSDADHGETASITTRRDIIKACGVLPFLALPAVASAATSLPKSLPEDSRQGTAALAEMDSQAPVPREAYKKLDSGVVYADLRPGSGADIVKDGTRVNLQWVLRRSNGYFVDSSEKNGSVPFIFTLGDGTAIQGLDEGVRGMTQGGVRRVLIPPSLAYVKGLEDGKPGPLPYGFGPRQQMRRVQDVRKDVPGEYIFLEVQITRAR
jgi:hypothetical protein